MRPGPQEKCLAGDRGRRHETVIQLVFGEHVELSSGDEIRTDCVISTADLLTESIRKIFTDDSVSEIFAGENQLF